MDRLNRPRGNGYALSRDLTPRIIPVAGCKPLGRESRKHPPQQVRKLAASLERFGFVLPILIDPEQRVVAGRPTGSIFSCMNSWHSRTADMMIRSTVSHNS
jgi:hypothetical protein